MRLILRSELNSKNKLSAINALAVPVPNHSFGILEWRKSEKMDWKTQKLLTMHGLHHPKGDVSRPYIKRCNGGRGLVQLMSAYSCSMVNLSDYIEQDKDRFCRLTFYGKCLDESLRVLVVLRIHPSPAGKPRGIM